MTDFDRNRQEALLRARMQPPKVDDFGGLQNGRADNYRDWEQGVRNQENNGGKDLPFMQTQQKNDFSSNSRLQQSRPMSGRLATNNHQQSREKRQMQENENVSHEDRLKSAQQGSNLSQAQQAARVANDLAQAATPMGAFSLAKHIDPLGDIPYFLAIGAALLKDLITLATFETIILPAIATALCSIFIFMMMLLVGGGSKRKIANSIAKKGLVLLAGSVVASVVPFVETLTVGIIYFMTLSERKSGGIPQENQNGETKEEDGGDEGYNEMA